VRRGGGQIQTKIVSIETTKLAPAPQASGQHQSGSGGLPVGAIGDRAK